MTLNIIQANKAEKINTYIFSFGTLREILKEKFDL